MREEGADTLDEPAVNAQVFVRSFFLESLWGYHTMQGPGFAFCLIPVFKRLFPDEKRGREAVQRCSERVNTHPSMGPLLAGIAAGFEQELEPEKIVPMRDRVMATLAALGDRVFWGHVRPLAAVLATLITLLLFGSLAGVFAFLVVFNVPNLIIRCRGFQWGRRKGIRVLRLLNSRTLDTGTHITRVLVLFLSGLLAGLLVVLAGFYAEGHESSKLSAGAVGIFSAVGIGAFVLLRLRVPVAAVLYAAASVVIIGSTIVR